MQITLNGQPHTTPEDATVAELLGKLDLQPIRVAVEINEDIVPRRGFDERRICEGDRVEVVTFVGGG